MLSAYLRDKLLNHTFRDDAYASPGTSIWLSLHVGEPGLSGASEAAGGSYGRVQFTDWSAPAQRASKNASEISFGTMSTALGTAVYLGIWDAESGGNFLGAVPIVPGLPLQVGVTPIFEAGQVEIAIERNTSLYLAHAWLGHVLRNTSFTSPGASIYVGLHTLPPGLTGAGEVSGNDYARAQCEDWNAPVDGEILNTNAVQFATPTGNWGNLTHFSVWDSAAAGNLLVVAPLPEVYPALSGDIGISFGQQGLKLKAI